MERLYSLITNKWQQLSVCYLVFSSSSKTLGQTFLFLEIVINL